MLDEPNSNLDAEGEEALTRAVKAVRARGGIVIVAAHRLGALDGVDTLLVMNGGAVQSYGPKADLLGRMARRSSAAPNVTPITAGAVR